MGEAATYRAKNHMQKGYYMMRHPLLHMRGKGKYLGMWVRLGRAKRLHAKEILHGALSLTVHRG